MPLLFAYGINGFSHDATHIAEISGQIFHLLEHFRALTNTWPKFLNVLINKQSESRFH